MQLIVEDLYHQFLEELSLIQKEEDNIIKNAEKSVGCAWSAFRALREYFFRYPPGSIAEEIAFFKQVKPLFLSRQIYHLDVLQFELKKPPHHPADQLIYYELATQRLKHFFEEHLEFYKYYRCGYTHFDEQYFTRNSTLILADMDRDYLHSDPQFSTPRDYTISKLMASEMMGNYLSESIASISHARESPHSIKPPITWTASKAGLIELVYAFQSYGVFNNGEADIRQISDYFQRIFNINLGNLYRTFQEIRIRKKGRVFFLEHLKEKLIQRMDNTDENPRQ